MQMRGEDNSSCTYCKGPLTEHNGYQCHRCKKLAHRKCSEERENTDEDNFFDTVYICNNCVEAEEDEERTQAEEEFQKADHERDARQDAAEAEAALTIYLAEFREPIESDKVPRVWDIESNSSRTGFDYNQKQLGSQYTGVCGHNRCREYEFVNEETLFPGFCYSCSNKVASLKQHYSGRSARPKPGDGCGAPIPDAPSKKINEAERLRLQNANSQQATQQLHVNFIMDEQSRANRIVESDNVLLNCGMNMERAANILYMFMLSGIKSVRRWSTYLDMAPMRSMSFGDPLTAIQLNPLCHGHDPRLPPPLLPDGTVFCCSRYKWQQDWLKKVVAKYELNKAANLQDEQKMVNRCAVLRELSDIEWMKNDNKPYNPADAFNKFDKIWSSELIHLNEPDAVAAAQLIKFVEEERSCSFGPDCYRPEGYKSFEDHFGITKFRSNYWDKCPDLHGPWGVQPEVPKRSPFETNYKVPARTDQLPEYELTLSTLLPPLQLQQQLNREAEEEPRRVSRRQLQQAQKLNIPETAPTKGKRYHPTYGTLRISKQELMARIEAINQRKWDDPNRPKEYWEFSDFDDDNDIYDDYQQDYSDRSTATAAATETNILSPSPVPHDAEDQRHSPVDRLPSRSRSLSSRSESPQMQQQQRVEAEESPTQMREEDESLEVQPEVEEMDVDEAATDDEEEMNVDEAATDDDDDDDKYEIMEVPRSQIIKLPKNVDDRIYRYFLEGRDEDFSGQLLLKVNKGMYTCLQSATAAARTEPLFKKIDLIEDLARGQLYQRIQDNVTGEDLDDEGAIRTQEIKNWDIFTKFANGPMFTDAVSANLKCVDSPEKYFVPPKIGTCMGRYLEECKAKTELIQLQLKKQCTEGGSQMKLKQDFKDKHVDVEWYMTTDCAGIVLIYDYLYDQFFPYRVLEVNYDRDEVSLQWMTIKYGNVGRPGEKKFAWKVFDAKNMEIYQLTSPHLAVIGELTGELEQQTDIMELVGNPQQLTDKKNSFERQKLRIEKKSKELRRRIRKYYELKRKEKQKELKQKKQLNRQPQPTIEKKKRNRQPREKLRKQPGGPLAAPQHRQQQSSSPPAKQQKEGEEEQDQQARGQTIGVGGKGRGKMGKRARGRGGKS